MATSSIFDTVKIKDSKTAESFIHAIEESEKAKETVPAKKIDSRMATREDSAKLREMRMLVHNDPGKEAIPMTLQQQAWGLINELQEEGVQAVIQVMILMLPQKKKNYETDDKGDPSVSPKMRAYLKMQELRKVTAKYDVSESQRAEALNEKFGTFG